MSVAVGAKRFCVIGLWAVVALLFSHPVLAAIAVYEFDDEAQEARFYELINELRCPKCQNQNIAGSNAPLAQDIKGRVYRLLQEQRSDQHITDYLVQRYGDFVTYRPPLRPGTYALWFGPLLLLVIVVMVVLRLASKKTPSSAVVVSDAERAQVAALLKAHGVQHDHQAQATPSDAAAPSNSKET